MISWQQSQSKKTSGKLAVPSFTMEALGVFQGDISLLSSRSVLECCVMPILMYGSENWILTEILIDKLETFQGELVKRC